jgi:predicted RNA-binding protein
VSECRPARTGVKELDSRAVHGLPSRGEVRAVCESNAFILRGEAEESVLRDVAVVEPVEGGYRLRNIFGEEATVRGRIQEINLLKHRILFAEE